MANPVRSLTMPASHPLRVPPLVVAVIALGVPLSAYAAVSADPLVVAFLYLVVGACVALVLTPQVFVAASVLVFAVSTSFGPVLQSVPVAVYVSDVMVGLIALRAAIPRERVPSARPLAGWPTVLFAVWAFLMTVASLRAIYSGIALDSAIRGNLGLVYWPLLYFGFSRVLRERALDPRRLWRNLAYVALGLAGWMFLARALNQPFDDPGLARVPTGDGEVVFRNFGFVGAFVVYPVLALAGVTGMAHGGAHRRQWALLAAVGVVATLLTLVRGGVFSLAFGILVVLALRPQAARSARVSTAIQLGLATATVLVGLAAVNPKLGNAVIQRTIPFTEQASEAEANAEYRKDAIDTGLRIANAHPLGLGVLDVAALEAEKIDKNFLAHSGVGTLFILGGWSAFVSAILLLFALIQRSARYPAPTPWLHPLFVGVLAMLGVYSLGAAGLVGDPWVIPLGALAVAVRFTLPLRGGSREREVQDQGVWEAVARREARAIT